METHSRQARLSFALVGITLLLGTCVPGLLLADFGPPVALRYLLAGLAFVVFPFAIGWLTPALWWLAAAGAVNTTLFAFLSLASDPPHTPAELAVRWPLFLPLLSTLLFAWLGRLWRSRSLHER